MDRKIALYHYGAIVEDGDFGSSHGGKMVAHRFGSPVWHLRSSETILFWRHAYLLTALLFGASFAIAQPPPDAIRELRAQGGEQLGQASRYACLMDIHRVQDKQSEGMRIEEFARLEVAFIDGEERYSWPGEAEFREDELREILVMGLSGAGSFASHVRSVVFGDATQFGEPVPGSGGSLDIPYRVPAEESGYLVNVDGKEIETAIEGSIELKADGGRWQILAFDLRATDLPAGFPATAVNESIHFGNLSGNHGSGLHSAVPKQAIQTMVESGRDEYRNEITFRDCREFRGESNIRFDGEGVLKRSGDSPADTQAKRPLPAGVPVDVELRSDIEWDKQRSGDVIEGKLTRDIRWKGRLLVEEGATVRGRILEFKRITGKSPGYLVGLSFNEIVEKKTIYPVRLGLESLPDVLKGPRRGIAAMVLGEDPRFRIVNRMGPSGRPYPGGGFFQVAGEELDLNEGFAMRWVVEGAPR